MQGIRTLSNRGSCRQNGPVSATVPFQAQQVFHLGIEWRTTLEKNIVKTPPTIFTPFISTFSRTPRMLDSFSFFVVNTYMRLPRSGNSTMLG